MLALRRATAGMVLVLGALLTYACGRQETPDPQKARQVEAPRQIVQTELQVEKAQRLRAEDMARAAEASRNGWIAVVGSGGVLACVGALLVGIHIGSRAAARYRKEAYDR